MKREIVMQTKKQVKVKPKKLTIASPKTSLYDKDFYAWIYKQAKLLENKDFKNLDIVNLIEEIESLARSDKSALRKHLTNLVMHKLKIKVQPEKHTKSWDRTIVNSQVEIEFIIEDSPSLKRELSQILEDIYPKAVKKASSETGLDNEEFPSLCPWKIKDLL